MDDIYWVTFDDEGYVKCMCPQRNKKCRNKKDMFCSEYIIKFSKIDRTSSLPSVNDLLININKVSTELEKSIKSLGNIRLKR